MKMDFTRNNRWLLDGYKTPDTIGSKHFGVVSRYSFRITFTYVVLNGINVFTEYIKNAYLQDPSSQKYFIICGKEFGLENKSKETLIRRALYGGKSAGRYFRNHLHACIRHMDLGSFLEDSYVYM